MSDEDDEVVILSMRIADFAMTPAVPGTTVIQCSQCGADVYASPSTLRVMRDNDAVVICNVCIPVRVVAALSKGDIDIKCTPDQVRECIEFGGFNPLDWLRSRGKGKRVTDED